MKTKRIALKDIRGGGVQMPLQGTWSRVVGRI